MRVIGWCARCRKVRQVTVSNAGLVTLARGGVAVGKCDDCQTKDDKLARRKETR